jgi:hypothetical protein
MWGHGPGEYVNLCDSCGLNWRRGKILQNAEYRQHLYKPAQKKPLGIPEHHQNSSIIPTSSEIYEDDHQASTTTEILCYEPHQNSSSTSKGSSDCYELVSGEDLTGLYNVNGATYTKSEEHLNEIETRHSITHQTSSIPQLVSEDFPEFNKVDATISKSETLLNETKTRPNSSEIYELMGAQEPMTPADDKHLVFELHKSNSNQTVPRIRKLHEDCSANRNKKAKLDSEKETEQIAGETQRRDNPQSFQYASELRNLRSKFINFESDPIYHALYICSGITSLATKVLDCNFNLSALDPEDRMQVYTADEDKLLAEGGRDRPSSVVQRRRRFLGYV